MPNVFAAVDLPVTLWRVQQHRHQTDKIQELENEHFEWIHLAEHREHGRDLVNKSKAVPLRHADTKGEKSYSSYSFLTSALDEGYWSPSRSGRALLWESTAGTHCTGGCVGLRAGLDTEARGKSFALPGIEAQ
jgi:hypothetical protein